MLVKVNTGLSGTSRFRYMKQKSIITGFDAKKSLNIRKKILKILIK